MEPPILRRGLFGFGAKSVRRFAADRDQMLTRATEEVRSATLIAHRLEGELATARTGLAEQAELLWTSEAHAREAQERAAVADARAAELASQLSRVGERSDPGDEERDAIEARASTLEPKLTVLRAALTREMQSVWAAEGRAYEMGNKLAKISEELIVVERELAVQRERAEAAEGRAAQAEEDSAGHSSVSTTDELASVLEAAEQAVTRIFEGARDRGENELRTAELEREQIRQEIGHLLSWRERVEPLIGPLQQSVDEATAESERLGALIREALEPVTSAMTMLGSRLGDLAVAAAEIPDDSTTADVERAEPPSEEEEATPGNGETTTAGAGEDEIQQIVDVSHDEQASATPWR